MNNWISVKDRLPPCDGTYLTLNINGYGATHKRKLCCPHGDCWGYMLRKFYFNKKIFTSKFGHQHVLYWMELPDVPYIAYP